MPTLLHARAIAKSYPSNPLFEGVDLHVGDGDRLGLIGPNGAGKSTFLKILAGLEDADGGEVIRRKGASVAYVGQADRFEPGSTPWTVALAAAESLVEDGRGGRLDPDTQAAIVLSQLGFEDLERPVEVLSGGWRKRLSIACGLVGEPDALLLDEPTNHLDLEGVLWLEDFVRRSRTTMILVTHDRRFLEATATRIVELSRAYPGGTFEAEGNYSEFVRRKEAFLEAQRAAASALANKVRQDDAWLRQGIKARETRNQSQVKAADARRSELRTSRDRLAAPERATTIDFQATERKTRKLVELVGVGKTMGDRELFTKLDLVLGPAVRLGLLGVNGSGKTTLLRIIGDDLAPDAGEVRRADNLRVVTFSQDRAALDPEATLHRALCPIGDHVEYRGSQVHVAGWAKRFLFDRDQLSTKVGLLSGGEQARVVVANLMLEPADVLLLDEPTNDLDIPSLEVLESSLLEFPGAIVLVTHDRFMLERIATDFVGLDGHGGVRHHMSIDHWLTTRAEAEAAATEKAAAATPAPEKPQGESKPKSKSKSRRPTWKEQREFESMEETILEAEEKVDELRAVTEDPSLAADHGKAADAWKALAAAETRVADLYARWAELEAIHAGDAPAG